jgi:hypothetical protein
MENKFKDTEKEFKELKSKYRQKEIDESEFKQSLKNLRVQDEEGKYWTIGAQTGKWYYFDGDNWIEASPPSLQEGKAICIYCGYENDINNLVCAHCGGNLQDNIYVCPKCGTKLDSPDAECPVCAGKKVPIRTWPTLEEIEKDDKVILPDNGGPNFVVHSVSVVSFLLGWGAIGLFVGIILGAFAGVTDNFINLIEKLPAFLIALHGKLAGALIYGLLGGVFCLVLGGLIGLLLALILNLILSFIGGIKIRLTHND